MREYIDDAIILNKRELGAQDARYSIFTKRFGKMVAKGKSVRKMTSKLAGHLEPGAISRVRLIEQHGLQVVDALKGAAIDRDLPGSISLKDLALLSRLLAEGEPELVVWNMVYQGVFDWRSVLAVLGWDPVGASCSSCGGSNVAVFSVARQDFFCDRCVPRINTVEMVVL